MKRSQDFRNKEVVNIYDGQRLGFVCDVEINFEKGVIEAIVIPSNSGFVNFFSKAQDYVIPWENIKKIGEDIILVDYNITNKIKAR